MTERVFKYQVAGEHVAINQGAFALELPEGARVTLCGMQHGVLCVWAIVDPEKRHERREFLLRGTGHLLPTNVRHVGSFMQNGGEFVWHLFEPNGSMTEEA